MPKKSICPETEMYFRTEDNGLINYNEEKCTVEFQSSGQISFDTYFNSFAIGKYNKYCNLSALYLKLKFCGLFVLRIFSIKKVDEQFEEKCILKEEIKSTDISDALFEIDTSDISDVSQIYFSLTSKENGKFYSGEFCCKSDILNSINIAVVICTYKREQYLLKNLNSINNYIKSNSYFTQDKIHFYIVDNGQTLTKKEIDNTYVSLFPNKNTGGSGGFKRGYIEAVHSPKKHTHILFMDDDIVLDCEVLYRVFMLLSFAKTEWFNLSVGGTMLKSSSKCIQHEAGALWNGRQVKGIGHNFDMSKRENVFNVSYYQKCDYNGWWFYCFPVDWHKRYGYPLQFFIKIDDVEYSVRCADEIAIINGIAVWHDDFENKYDGYMEYYIKRNELILASVNDQKPYTLFQVRKLVANVARQLVEQRYFIIDLVFRAYDDYLLGYEHFMNVDTEKLNLELINSVQKFIPEDELKEEYGVYFDEEKYKQSLDEYDNIKKQALTLNGYLIPSCFYHKDKDGFSIADVAKCKFVNFYKHKKVLQYDIKNKRGFVTVQKRTKLIKYGFMLVVKSIKFIVKYPKVRKGFKEHLKDMSLEEI